MTGLARRWFDPLELQWMATQPDHLTAFLHLWTAKEAVGKALGVGLQNPGLRRRMPLPTSPTDLPPLRARVVPSEPTLTVLHLPVDAPAVLALALPATTAEVTLVEHHGAGLRRTVGSRTSFPVVSGPT
ncbi:4'-phosphopantetheinyl transferase superfamily protein [Kribbella sp. NPDC002412]